LLFNTTKFIKGLDALLTWHRCWCSSRCRRQYSWWHKHTWSHDTKLSPVRVDGSFIDRQKDGPLNQGGGATLLRGRGREITVYKRLNLTIVRCLSSPMLPFITTPLGYKSPKLRAKSRIVSQQFINRISLSCRMPPARSLDSRMLCFCSLIPGCSVFASLILDPEHDSSIVLHPISSRLWPTQTAFTLRSPSRASAVRNFEWRTCTHDNHKQGSDVTFTSAQMYTHNLGKLFSSLFPKSHNFRTQYQDRLYNITATVQILYAQPTPCFEQAPANFLIQVCEERKKQLG
jgi:hypothetical protein